MSLEVRWAGEGWPSDVRLATADVGAAWPPTWILAARHLSPGSIELLRHRGANFVDEAGNARLVVPPVLAVSRHAPAGPRLEPPGFAWSRSSVELAELLLMTRPERIEISALARRTGWSAPQISNVLRAFDDQGFTRREGPARGPGVWRELTNPGSMLEAWSAHLLENRPKRRLGYRLLRDPLHFARTILPRVLGESSDEAGWALTGWTGLELLAPFTTLVPIVQVYVASERLRLEGTSILDALELEEVSEGANVELWKAEFPMHLAAAKTGDPPVIGASRLYADLLALGDRASVAAAHLREVVLGF